MIRRRNVWIMLNRIKTKWLTNCPYFKGWKLILLCFLDFRQVKEMRWLLKFRKNALLGTNGGFTTNKYRMKYCWLSTVRQTPSLDSMEWKFWYRQRMDTFCRKQIKLDSTCFLIPGAKVKKQTNTHIHIYSTILFINQNQHCFLYKSFVCVRWWCPPPWWKSTAGVRSEWRWDCLHGRMVWHWPQVLELRTGTFL